MKKSTAWILIIVAFIVGGLGAYWIEKGRGAAAMQAYQMSVQKQLSDAQKMANEQAMKPTGTMQSETIMMAKGTGVITDAKGMTLYTYAKDTANTSNCTGVCLQNWPPFLEKGMTASLPTNLGTFKRTDGSTQYTWKGMPLYYYIGDKKAGDVTGDGVGGIWHVAK